MSITSGPVLYEIYVDLICRFIFIQLLLTKRTSQTGSCGSQHRRLSTLIQRLRRLIVTAQPHRLQGVFSHHSAIANTNGVNM